ncbi:hypothetical protein OIU74_026867 [Salix koriyanagi]|uniref:Uncharacterized protein n=1 Tax=Salix koriyanagi TaxID=2511006 RepID=A0A9Q0W0B0_9ROSI|nr:hypothetical protein OIU74_026867 [Salix koriyanagi]
MKIIRFVITHTDRGHAFAPDRLIDHLSIKVVWLLQVLEAGGAEPGLLIHLWVLTTACDRATVPANLSELLLSGRTEDTSSWVWGPVLVGLGLDHLIRHHIWTQLIV